MLRKVLKIVVAFVVLVPAEVRAQTIAVPPDAKLVRQVEGGGAQVYACRVGAGSTYVWALVGPKAVLINEDGSDFGTHGAGPHWTASDGSTIVADAAHPLARVNRPDAVPELVLRVTSETGSGMLAGIRYVSRTDTLGGTPPESGCDAQHVGATIARHYSAVYSFYR